MSKESCKEDATVRQFWAMPELVRILLLYLNLESTSNLAHSKVMNINILQGTCDWDKLIRRNYNLRDGPKVRLAEVKTLVGILKLMKERTTSVLHLLHLICEKSPAGRTEVQMACPCRTDSHVVRFLDFQFLEEIEGAFGSTEQTVESVKGVGRLKPFSALSALSSRLSRQQQKMNTFHAVMINLQNRAGAEAFRVIMQACQRFSLGHSLWVGQIGQEGWEAVAEGLHLHPGVVIEIQTSKRDMEGGSRDDMRKVWDSLSTHGTWSIVDENCIRQQAEYIGKEDGEPAFSRLEQILDMSREEWDDDRQIAHETELAADEEEETEDEDEETEDED